MYKNGLLAGIALTCTTLLAGQVIKEPEHQQKITHTNIPVLLSSTSISDKKHDDLEKCVDTKILDFLTGPFVGFESEGLRSKSFEIIALTNMADGFYNLTKSHPEYTDDAISYLEKIVAIAIESKIDVKKHTDFKSYDNIYLSYTNIILGRYQDVAKDNKFFELNKQLTEYLLKITLNDPQHNPISYRDSTYKRPADEAVLLYSLYLYDKNYKTEFSEKITNLWLKNIKDNATDKKTGMPFFDLTSEEGKTPRGSSISQIIKYIAEINPVEANDMWKKYKSGFFKDFIILAGFREYPKDREREEDLYSGPILDNIGTTATTYGYNIAMRFDDKKTASKLYKLLTTGKELVKMSDKYKRASENLLSKSVEFSSQYYQSEK